MAVATNKSSGHVRCLDTPIHASISWLFAFMATAPRLNKLPQRLGQVSGRLPTMQDDSWRTDKQSSAARGYGHKWREARAAYLKSHPLCVYCARAGRVTAADVVDHIEPHRGDIELFWQRSNWQAMCAHCHNTVKAQEEGRHSAKSTFDASGRVVW